MNCKIPFTKDIPFEKKLYEITSISLEHELKLEKELLKGNFIISGDFKSHEVSVNKEAFSYILPFEITLSENIDEKTIEFMIEDFTYEVLENNILRVKIDFNVIGSIKEEPERTKEETIFLKPDNIPTIAEIKGETPLPQENDRSEITNNINNLNLEQSNIHLSKEDLTENLIDKKEDETMNINTEENKEIIENKLTKTQEEELTISTIKPNVDNDSNAILNNLNTQDNEFATYHIHMVNDGETIETICTMYNSNMDILSEYNELKELSPKDKIIIPEKDE